VRRHPLACPQLSHQSNTLIKAESKWHKAASLTQDVTCKEKQMEWLTKSQVALMASNLLRSAMESLSFRLMWYLIWATVTLMLALKSSTR